MTPLRKSLLRASAALALFAASVAPASDLLPPGFRPLPLGVHALVGGKVVIKPGQVLDGGTIVIRDGLIQAVGTNIIAPADARVWNMKGTTIYAGFIEPYLVLNTTNPPISTSDVEPISNRSFTSGGVKFYGAPGAQTDTGNPGPGYEIAKITPEFRAMEKYSPNQKALAPLRELGFTTGVIAPAKGIIRGTSALVALTDENPNQAVIKPDVFQHIAFETHEDDEKAYPGSLMGVIAAIRQSFFDAQHDALERSAQNPQNHKRLEYDPALPALAPAAQKKMRVVFEPGSALMVDRSAQMAQEIGLDFCIVSCGQEWRRPDLARNTHATFIVPVDFPTLPKMPGDDDWQQVKLDQLRAWDWAPENPALLRQQGLEIALTTYGLTDRKNFRQNLRLALDRGLSEEDALAALTTVPAKLCGVENQLGTIETNKLADLVVVTGTNYFNPDAKVQAVWIDGRIFPTPEEASSAKTDEAKPVEPASAETTPAKEEPEKHTEPPSVAKPETKSAATNAPAAEKPAPPSVAKKEQLRALQKTRIAHSPMDGRGAITNPPAVLIQHATIWTSGPQGILTNASLLVSGGKILSVGDLSPEPTNALVIDAAGESVTPGIIDCHSHTAILGAVNESTLPSTAMVRIRDVVNSETENIYEQLAGGVTMVNLLHGSANPIGGQNAVIKLRDGDSPEDLIFSNAPPGIKFALGENVKQSNWGEKFTTRFPQTRMGVRTFYENRFTAAQQYLQAWDDYQKNAGQPGSVPPRRDLELEAIGEILQGKRLIHCHAYRQDEMLMLMRTMESFGVRIAAFHHVLEGYKIADEIAAHGAGGTTFSDWWAYKFEVYDAIPYNGSLMRERGVVVSFNSDSSELARRLYLEAAKAVKYGGTPQPEALKFVTLNPAKQLHVDQWVGSLEPGKDADFVIWSKSPLDSGTVCLQTWIDGKKYFDRSLNDARIARLKKERDDLLAKAKQIAKLSGGGNDGSSDDGKSFFSVSLEHEYDRQERHCLDELTEAGE
jgi:imidazolonepropionase-like amidohydrolase